MRPLKTVFDLFEAALKWWLRMILLFNSCYIETYKNMQTKAMKKVRIHTILRITIRKTFLLDRNQVDTISKGIFQHIYCAFISLLKSVIIKKNYSQNWIKFYLEWFGYKENNLMLVVLSRIVFWQIIYKIRFIDFLNKLVNT